MKMILLYFILLMFSPFIYISCLNDLQMEMSLEYYKFKKIHYVCLLSCLNYQGVLKFAKLFANNSIFISIVKIDFFNLDEENKHKLLEPCWKQHLNQVGIVIDGQCHMFQTVMEYASQERMFLLTHQWLIFQDYNSKETYSYKKSHAKHNDSVEISKKIIDVLGMMNISVDADIVLSAKSGPTNYKLYDIFNYGRIQGGKLNIENFGAWNKHGGLMVFLPEYKYKRRSDFQGLGLRMVFVKSNPKNINAESLYTRSFDPEINGVTKVTVKILIDLAEEHNIKFVYKAVDRWIGTYERNSSRVVSNSLAFREQDITPLLRATPDLIGKLEFAQPATWYISSRFYYRIPTTGLGKFENNFLSPLSTSVWICVTFALIFCGIILLLSALLERRPASAQYAIFSVIASVCQQYFEDVHDNTVARESCARKVTMLITGISCVLIYNYYTSSVVSNLLNGPPPSINSLEELANSPLDVVLEDVGVSRSWLYTPGYTFNNRLGQEEAILRKSKIFNKKPGEPVLVTLDDGIKMVKSGGYALAALEMGANTKLAMVLNKMEMCEIGTFWVIYPTAVFPALQYRSPYREFFVWGLTSMKERGLINCVHQRLRVPEIRCDGTVPRALALGGAAPAFMLLILGCMAALMIMVAEIVSARLSAKKPLKY